MARSRDSVQPANFKSSTCFQIRRYLAEMAAIVRPKDPKVRLKHLIQSTAFDDVRHTFTRGYKHGVKKHLDRWLKINDDCVIHNSPQSYKTMKANTHGYTLPSFNNTDIKTIPSSTQRHIVVDNTGRILAYKFQVPIAMIETVNNSATKLPHANIETHQRGEYERVHYALWADSSPTIRHSAEFVKDQPASEDFLQANQALFDRLSMELRLLSPETYVRYTMVDPYLKDGLRRLAGAWHGVVVNRQIGSNQELKTHQDWKDYKKGFNAVVPWGDYEGGELTMWPLGLRWELKPGDAILFVGSVIAHGVEDVTSGVRNSLDLMTHSSSIKWAERMRKEDGKWT